MTKIKNTKKGMAKKTLSISLAVAMLATSNVPVWAAEDLFTDGEVAVEAFTAEEVVEEAPVVEEAEDVVDAQATESKYDVEWKDFSSTLEWGVDSKDVRIKVTDRTTPVKSNLKARWVNEKGNASDVYTDVQDLSVGADGYATYNIGTFSPEDCKNNLKLRIQVYEEINGEITWSELSDVISVVRRDVVGTVNVEHNIPVYYTGSQITSVPGFKIDTKDLTFTDKAGNNLGWLEEMSDMTFENFHGVGADTVNAYEVSGKTVVSEGSIVSDYFTGKVDVTFRIWRKEIKNASEAVTVELPKYNYQYTGDDIFVETNKVTVTEKLTGNKVANVVENPFWVGKDATETADDSKKARILYSGVLKNYHSQGGWDTENVEAVKPVNSVKVDKRNLADPANTTLSISSVSQEALGDGMTIAGESLKNNLTIKDYDGTDITASLKGHVNVKFKVNGRLVDSIVAHDGDTITAYISGDSANNFTDDVAEVEFKVVDHDIANATFDKEGFVTDADVTYTGKQITLGLTKDNITEKLGVLRAYNGTVLSADTQYDVNVVFGENVNAGDNAGQVIINGKGDYAGTQKVMYFDIKQRPADKLNVPEKVLYNDSYLDADEYTLETSVTATVDADTLTVPTEDYKVVRRFVDANGNEITDKYEGNKVGNYVETTVTLTNKAGNFTFNPFTERTLIVNKAITDADVILEKTEYTYNAAKVMPEYKVVVDGVTLVEGKDYTVVVTNNDKVGEANLTVTGKGEYDTTTSVTKKFNIVAANVSNIKVEAKKDAIVYDGARHVGTKTTNDLVFSIDGNVIDLTKDEFVVTYPTAKEANLNAGDGYVSLKPANTNKNFVGADEFTFVISPATLDKVGELTAYDKNGTNVDFAEVNFKYNSTAHTFADAEFKYVPESPMKFTENDYEIIYKDNVFGKDGKGHLLVVAKGNYAGKDVNDYKCADGTVVKNVIADKEFAIAKLNIKDALATVENGSYSEGNKVAPVVTVTYYGTEGKELFEQKLVEGKDYKLVYTAADDANRTEVTNGKTLKVKIEGIGGFNGWVSKESNGGWFAWGIDKFDLENAEVIVTGTDAEPVVKVINSGKVVSADEYDLVAADGEVTITAKETSKHYTGTKTVEIKEALEKPVAPMIERVEVAGNKATVILSGESEGAIGYDYVISTDRDCITNKDYDKVNKNKLTTDTTFQYVEQGMYYAYCHAWTRDENGKKVFSDWSNGYPFSVTAITPSQPTITSVKQKGSTVTVTYTESKDAIGYDVVLGSAMATVNNERRPVDYGTLVEKNATTTTVTFKNVPAGKYYVGLHSYNRTSEDGKKVFSPWSVAKTITVK